MRKFGERQDLGRRAGGGGGGLKMKLEWEKKERKAVFSLHDGFLPANRGLSFNTRNPSCGFTTITRGAAQTASLPRFVLHRVAHTLPAL